MWYAAHAFAGAVVIEATEDVENWKWIRGWWKGWRYAARGLIIAYVCFWLHLIMDGGFAAEYHHYEKYYGWVGKTIIYVEILICLVYLGLHWLLSSNDKPEALKHAFRNLLAGTAFCWLIVDWEWLGDMLGLWHQTVLNDAGHWVATELFFTFALSLVAINSISSRRRGGHGDGSPSTG